VLEINGNGGAATRSRAMIGKTTITLRHAIHDPLRN